MKYAIKLAEKLLGTPYKWGGNNVLQGGLDCSGFVCELLRTEGIVKDGEDYPAQGLYDKFLSTPAPKAGDLVFFGASSQQITHVGFMLNELQMVEAGGGGSAVTNLDVAARLGAMIRIRPFNKRADVIGFRRPPYKVLDL